MSHPPIDLLLPDDPSAMAWVSPGTRLLHASSQRLATHYGDMLAFEWRQRRRRCESTAHGFAQLRRWDERIQAYLNGFQLLGAAGIDPALDRLQDPVTEGEFFSLASQALVARHRGLLQACIGLVQALPHFSHAFHAALEWTDWSTVEFALTLWPVDDPLRQAAVLRSLARHDVEVDPAYVIDCAPRLSTQPMVQLSALRCALSRGESGWAWRAPDLVHADQPDLRLAAAESLIVFGDDAQRRGMLPVLRDLALGGSGRIAMLATRELMTIGGAESDQLLDALAADPTRIRQHLAAIGWCGDLTRVAVLAGWLDDPIHARAAGAAITTLTGSCPQDDGWALEPTIDPPAADPGSDRVPPTDPDADLPWPSRAAFARWWTARQTQRPAAGRQLAGRPREASHLLALLRHGRLASRPQAAWLLQVVSRGQRLPHLAPAPRQSALIDQLTETDPRG